MEETARSHQLNAIVDVDIEPLNSPAEAKRKRAWTCTCTCTSPAAARAII